MYNGSQYFPLDNSAIGIADQVLIFIFKMTGVGPQQGPATGQRLEMEMHENGFCRIHVRIFRQPDFVFVQIASFKPNALLFQRDRFNRPGL